MRDGNERLLDILEAIGNNLLNTNLVEISSSLVVRGSDAWGRRNRIPGVKVIYWKIIG